MICVLSMVSEGEIARADAASHRLGTRMPLQVKAGGQPC